MISKQANLISKEIGFSRVSGKGLHISPLVSAVIITFNEENNIGKTLAQLKWCDEIIIVDSYSTDNTVAICEKYGCKIFYKKFEGYGEQKTFALSKSTNDWVLCIDADEVISDKLVIEIKEALITNNKVHAGFSFRMNLVFLNKEFLYGRESGKYFTRLFNKQLGGFTDDKVHESIGVRGSIKKLKNTVRHNSYTNLHQCLEKNNRYSTYSAQMAFNKGKNKSLLAILFGLPFNFFKYYIIELNFLNGRKGFYWSVFSSFYHFSKYVKLNELNKVS